MIYRNQTGNSIYILFVITSLVAIIISCSPIQQEPLDYCDIFEKDRSHVNVDKQSKSYLEDSIKRAKNIIENWKKLEHEVKTSGFPDIHPYSSGIDSCRYWAVTMTFIHIVQNSSNEFIKKKNMNLMKKEIDAGRMSHDFIFKCFKIGLMTNSFCLSQKEKLNHALKYLNIKRLDLDVNLFKKC